MIIPSFTFFYNRWCLKRIWLLYCWMLHLMLLLSVSDLSWNQLSRLEESSFVGLSVLEQLHIGNNHISFIADGAFRGLANLQALWVFMQASIFMTWTSLFCCLVLKNGLVWTSNSSGEQEKSCFTWNESFHIMNTSSEQCSSTIKPDTLNNSQKNLFF